MKKIKTLFHRDWNGNPDLVTRELEPECTFAMLILANECIPTRKLDGTSCLVKDGILYKRFDRKRRGKRGKELDEWKAEPPGWIPCEKDERTGHWWGWAMVDLDAPENWMHKEAWEGFTSNAILNNGTYELCGPKVNANREHVDRHVLLPHGEEELEFRFTSGNDPYDEVKAYLEKQDIEGIVWWKDGVPVAKIKKCDFGLDRVPGNVERGT